MSSPPLGNKNINVSWFLDFIWTYPEFCQTPVLGLGLGVDFTLANNKKNNDNKNNDNKNNNNPHPNFPGWDGTRGLKFGIQT